MTKHPKPGEFTALQAKWRAVHDAREAFEISLHRKYGRFDRSWLSGADRNRLDQLDQRAHKASDKVFEWLDRWSPWDWGHGVAAIWVLVNLTEAEALSRSAPMLPAASAGYGYQQVDRQVRRR